MSGRNTRVDVVDRAVAVLDDYGLGDLTMRRLAAELGVRPSALYHHFPDKQTLLGAVADEILARGLRPDPGPAGGWREATLVACRRVRDALLAYRDGVEVVATARAFGLGGRAAYDEVAGALGDADDGTTARALLHLVLGHVGEEQTHLQAVSVGAVDGEATALAGRSDFNAAVGLVLDGLASRRVSTGSTTVGQG